MFIAHVSWYVFHYFNFDMCVICRVHIYYLNRWSLFVVFVEIVVKIISVWFFVIIIYLIIIVSKRPIQIFMSFFYFAKMIFFLMLHRFSKIVYRNRLWLFLLLHIDFSCFDRKFILRFDVFCFLQINKMLMFLSLIIRRVFFVFSFQTFYKCVFI